MVLNSKTKKGQVFFLAPCCCFSSSQGTSCQMSRVLFRYKCVRVCFILFTHTNILHIF